MCSHTQKYRYAYEQPEEAGDFRQDFTTIAKKAAKMKIAFIVGPFPALSKTFILNQITGLIDLGHEVDIFTINNPKEPVSQHDISKYNIPSRIYLKMPANKILRAIKSIGLIITNFHKDPAVILKSLDIFKFGKHALSLQLLYTVISFLRKGPYDIIHCHFGPNGSLGACLKQLGIQGKLVTTFHGYDIRLGIEKGGSIYSQLFKYGDCFLAISNYNYENLVNFGADPQKIIFHPVGIDLNKFPFRRQSTNSENSDSIVILTVARLVKEKGLKYGIRAIGELTNRFPELKIEYRIVGGGPLKKQLLRLVEEMKLSETVKFLGPLEQAGVVREMSRAHLFLLPSIAEALPVSLMEAQSIGLPIVATNVGSVYQVIVDGKSGFLVPSEDVNALVKKLEYLIEHREKWSEMGKAGREFVEKNYNIKKLNQQLVEIYQDLI